MRQAMRLQNEFVAGRDASLPPEFAQQKSLAK
jgi:hypothetical protein